MTKSFQQGKYHLTKSINLYRNYIEDKSQTPVNYFYQTFHHVLLMCEYLSHSDDTEISPGLKKQFGNLRHGLVHGYFMVEERQLYAFITDYLIPPQDANFDFNLLQHKPISQSPLSQSICRIAGRTYGPVHLVFRQRLQ